MAFDAMGYLHPSPSMRGYRPMLLEAQHPGSGPALTHDVRQGRPLEPVVIRESQEPGARRCLGIVGRCVVRPALLTAIRQSIDEFQVARIIALRSRR